MLNAIPRRRAQVLAPFVFVLVLLTAAAFAVPQLIIAREGGVVNIADGAELVIPPNALKEDTVVSADMKMEQNLVVFEFGPDGTRFSRPAMLCISWQLIEDIGDVKDLTLYGEGNEKVKPKAMSWGLVYRIKHFSLYYYRRR